MASIDALVAAARDAAAAQITELSTEGWTPSCDPASSIVHTSPAAMDALAKGTQQDAVAAACAQLASFAGALADSNFSDSMKARLSGSSSASGESSSSPVLRAEAIAAMARDAAATGDPIAAVGAAASQRAPTDRLLPQVALLLLRAPQAHSRRAVPLPARAATGAPLGRGHERACALGGGARR